MIFLNKDAYIRICDLENNLDFLFQQIDVLEDRLKKVEKEKKAIEKTVRR